MKKLLSIAMSAIMTAAVLAPCQGALAAETESAAPSAAYSLSSSSKSSEESKFEIDSNGVITAYKGLKSSITVPDTINSVTPTEIGDGVFESNLIIRSITLPDTVTKIGANAFKKSYIETVTGGNIEELGNNCFTDCKKLKSIDLSSVIVVGENSFSGCTSLTDNLNLPKLTVAEQNAFAGSSFKSIKLESVAQIKAGAFKNAKAVRISLGKAEYYDSTAFTGCTELQKLYAPNLKSFSSSDFQSSKLTVLFLPNAQTINLTMKNGLTLYCGDKLNNANIENSGNYKLTVVGGNDVVKQNITDTSFTHTSSDSTLDALGAQIRTSDNGLRFGFRLNMTKLNLDLVTMSDELGFGFVYSYDSFEGKTEEEINFALRYDSSSVHTRASDYQNTGETIYYTFNAVFTGIPSAHLDDKVSIRAYFCIDGMYFYSPVIIRSYGDVASAVLSDSSVEQGIKQQVNSSLNKEV